MPMCSRRRGHSPRSEASTLMMNDAYVASSLLVIKASIRSNKGDFMPEDRKSNQGSNKKQSGGQQASGHRESEQSARGGNKGGKQGSQSHKGGKQGNR